MPAELLPFQSGGWGWLGLGLWVEKARIMLSLASAVHILIFERYREDKHGPMSGILISYENCPDSILVQCIHNLERKQLL